mmetsp:Transcript_17689/g.17405  ORF Transcript_17689/g.17405 Transcript_17689/m.17405 type:complete len:117 (-) Transcript_17689:15-365(-)
MIGDMIRVNKFISPYGKKDLPKDIFLSGYSIQMHDFAAAISGCLSTFKYELDNSALELYSPETVNNLKAWPSRIHHQKSDEVLGVDHSPLYGTRKYQGSFKNMMMDYLVNHMFHKQ